jgi:WD40 repeat protein
VIGDENGQIRIYNFSSLSLVNSFQAHPSNIYRIKQSPFNTNTNTNYVATCSEDRTVKIWNVSSSFDWTLITTYSQHSSGVQALEWLDNDTLAFAGVTDRTIKLWSRTTGQTKLTIKTNQYVYSLKLLNTNIHLAAGLDREINIYNINDGNLVSSLKGHTASVMDLVQISADLLASSSRDQTVRIWNLTTNTCKFILTGHTNSVYGLKQITPNILASGSDDRTIKLWNITSGQLIRNLTGHTNWIMWSVDLLNSQTLVSGSGDGTIKLWNWSTGECLSTIQTQGSRIWSLAVINFDQQQQTRINNNTKRQIVK